MDILYYFNDIETIMFQWQKSQIVDELRHYGWKMDIISPTEFNSCEEANEKIIETLMKYKYDIFLTCLSSNYLYVETIKKIKELGIATVLFCPDNLLVPYDHKDIAPLFDVVWLTSKDTEYLFKKWGASTIMLPYAANPFIRTNITNTLNKSIAFIGTPYGCRANQINELTQNKITVSLFGPGNVNNSIVNRYNAHTIVTFFENLRFPIGRKVLLSAVKQKLSKQAELINNPYLIRCGFAENLYDIYGSYPLSLSSTTARNTGILKEPVYVVNLRSFEIPMSLGVQFCKYNEELSHYFEENKEIVFFHDSNDMLEKARYYLDERNEQEIFRIRKNARIRAENEHTWFKRFEAISSRL